MRFNIVIAILCIVPFIVFYLSRMYNERNAEKKKQDEMKREASEKIMLPERKLHEEEGKRWEDEYWKRHQERER
jgi:hypothetical protein